MAVGDEPIAVVVDGGEERLPATLVSPGRLAPGFLFLQGWGSTREQYLARARETAALGCVCLTFEPRGMARSDPRHATVTCAENLRDVLAAYDALTGRSGVDPAAVAVVGSSYGAYVATILSPLRPVRWVALRVPALYKDEHWDGLASL